MARKQIDWEAVERDYRIGDLTRQQICDTYSVSQAAISKKAKAESWTRDLSKAVKLATKAKVRAEVVAKCQESVNSVANDTADAVDSIATRNSALISGHQAGLGAVKDVARGMIGELGQLLGKSESIKAVVMAVAEEHSVLADSIAKACSLTNRANVVEKVAATLIKVIDAERKSYGLGDEASKGGSTLESVLEELRREEAP